MNKLGYEFLPEKETERFSFRKLAIESITYTNYVFIYLYMLICIVLTVLCRYVKIHLLMIAYIFDNLVITVKYVQRHHNNNSL